MMVGIGLGIMAILCAVGLIGGGLSMHHEWKGKKDHAPVQQNYDHPEAAESSSQGRTLEEQENSSIPWTTTEENREGESSLEVQ
jgi:hypothetical protein